MTDVPDPDDATPAELILAVMAGGVPPGRADPHDRLAACPNCDTPFDLVQPPNFCPHCGQPAVLHAPSVTEFAHEFVGHYIALEGPLWRTLWLLVARPGELTCEYLRGRRRRYVLPLRLYLSASFLFFLVFKLLPASDTERVFQLDQPHRATATARAASSGASIAAADEDAEQDDADLRSAVAAARQAASHAAGRSAAAHASGAARGGAAEKDFESDPDALHCAATEHVCLWFQHTLQSTWSHWKHDPEGARESFKAHWLASAPYAMFLMQPVFAAIVQLAYRRRHLRFGEHVVFSMHVHAFWFLLILVASPLPGLGRWVSLGLAVYTVLALHRVYGGRWGPTLARAATIGVGYSIALGLALGLLSVFAVLH